MYRTIIIEDEKPARERLIQLLSNYPQKIKIIAEAENGELGLKLIEAEKPDLIFLDIQMPGLNGFELLKQLNYVPLIIFTTAYEQYAIKAFEENSIDYILKPIDRQRLDQAIKKLDRLKSEPMNGISDILKSVLEDIKSPKEITSITVKIGDKLLLIPLEDVVYFEAKDKYVTVNEISGKEYIINHPLSFLQEKLPEYFLRIHRGLIINKNKIKEIHKYFKGKLKFIMNNANKTELVSGNNYSEDIKALFEL